jgi:3-deoxy-D-manno-octulosonic-acid transferase
MDAVYAGLTVLLAPYAAVRMARDPKTRSRWKAYARDMATRFGRRRRRVGPWPCVWVHGVSVGEVKAAARLVEAVERAVPGVEVVISVTTDTGSRVARDLYPGRRVEFYPPDLSWIVGRALDSLRPDLMILVESEFWPNFLSAARERGIPVALVNGRISAGSAARFRAAGPLARPLLGSLSSVCVQMEVYAERFRSLGIEPDRLHVTGNMKFDNIPIERRPGRHAELGRLLGLEDGVAVVVAGSTHPGEERALARIRRRLGERGRPFRLVVAPRHPARADTVEADIRREGLAVARRSRVAAGAPPGPLDVVLLDTVGELEEAYALSDAVFVGGTLVPHGGQNMMEPASLGLPVVVGPHVHNFRGEVDMLLQVGGLAVAADEAAVEATIEGWLADPEKGRAFGRRAREAILASKGATDRTLEVLAPLLAPLRARAVTPPAPRATAATRRP